MIAMVVVVAAVTVVVAVDAISDGEPPIGTASNWDGVHHEPLQRW